MSHPPHILAFDELSIDVAGVSRPVLVARPKEELRLDVRRLERMREGDFSSKLDQDIVAAMAERKTPCALVVFNTRDTNGGSLWGFDPDLEDEQRMEFGRRLLRSQIALYRQLIEHGASGLAGVGFGSYELAAFQRGTVRVVTDLSEELESADEARAAEIEAELWLIEHAAKWTGLSLADYAEQGLASDIAGCDAKRPEIQALLAKL